MNNCKDEGIKVKIYREKVLPTKTEPDSIYFIKADGDTEISTYITDINGVPWALKDSGGNLGIQTVFNVDGTITVSGSNNVEIKVSIALQNLINSALQSGDNISSLINNAGYITNADLPDTKAEYNTELTDGDFLFVGDILPYTDEQAQDAIGTVLMGTSTVDLIYNDITPSIVANVKLNSITSAELSNTINVSEFVNDIGYALTTYVNLQDNLKVDKVAGERLITAIEIVNLSNQSGVNTGDNAVNTLYSGLVSNATHTGDVTGATVLTLAAVNSNTGDFGTSSNVPQYTVNAKGLITASANIPIAITKSQVTGLVSDLAGKQPTLIAGTNITILGNTISASGGTGGSTINGTFTPTITTYLTPLKSYYSKTGNILTIQLNFNFTPTAVNYGAITSFTLPNSYVSTNTVVGRVIGTGILVTGANISSGGIIAQESSTSTSINLNFGHNAFNTGLLYWGSIAIQIEVN